MTRTECARQRRDVSATDSPSSREMAVPCFLCASLNWGRTTLFMYHIRGRCPGIGEKRILLHTNVNTCANHSLTNLNGNLVCRP